MVAPRGQPGSIVDSRLSEMGLERRVARGVSSFWAAMVLVSRPEFIAILPRAAVQAMKGQVELVTVRPPFPLAGFAYDLVWHNRLDGVMTNRFMAGRRMARRFSPARSATPTARWRPRSTRYRAPAG